MNEALIVLAGILVSIGGALLSYGILLRRRDAAAPTDKAF